MPLTTAMDNNILNEIFGGSNWAPPATLYMGLSTTAPNKDTTGVSEPVGNAYARVAITNNATNFPAAAGSSKSNGTVITFPQATGAWGTPNNWVLYDAATAGNLIAYGAITTPKAIGSGDTPSFAANGLTITMS